ncbi:hypothetical protein HX109_06330 [Galbibacter sp. BG1]|uniref:hypothetical protein n=1 Tax=Galbibacter sp. BG1 TaxID=1170699 RepID=UPI0015B92239|nr:hypothetical protein [Galbibacter sp. BG1]QLE01199.1 hypothetical protein HX109_06330 [Galbibacter sp. BG1]
METQVLESQKCELVKGAFSATDAKEILGYLFDKKINFHECRNWSHEERFGTKDEYSVIRIGELRKSKKQLMDLISAAQEKNAPVHINSSITVEIAE